VKLILSSFGFALSPYEDPLQLETGEVLWREASPWTALRNSRFFRMPPIHLGRFGPVFMPDYAALLLFDQFIIDSGTRESIASNPLYSQFNLLIEALDKSNRLETVDFRDTVRPHAEAINAAVDYDLQMLSAWLPAFERLLRSWSRFTKVARRYRWQHRRLVSGAHSGVEEELKLLLSEYGGAMLRGVVREILDEVRDAIAQGETNGGGANVVPESLHSLARVYLHHTASTLCLADIIGAPVHEWNDIQPLYEQKLKLSLRRQVQQSEEMEVARQLFDLMFPDIWFADPNEFLKVLDDRRLDGLRSLISAAVGSGQSLDGEFVSQTIAAVVKGERVLQRKKAIYGWMTMPVSVIPWAGDALKKGADDAVGAILERRIRRNYGWVIVISEHSDRVFKIADAHF
jgi:hypothetical protein